MAVIGRKDWVQADLRCLMCGRVAGRMIGPLPAAMRHLTCGPPSFSAFRPADDREPAFKLVGGEQIRCPTCGGAVLMDEVETFSTYPDTDIEDTEPRPRRGRPPKPWNRPTTQPRWFEALGIAG
jgi:DNA-directed RNA polymerase subunit RPC12/RpoP